MNITRKALAALFAVAMISAVFIAPASAHTGSPPSGCSYLTASYGSSCFEWHGDDHWVQDYETNGWGVGVQIETDYGKTRVCENTHGANSWHECKYNHREERCLRWRMYERNYVDGDVLYRNFTGWTSWHDISDGGRCDDDVIIVADPKAV